MSETRGDLGIVDVLIRRKPEEKMQSRTVFPELQVSSYPPLLSLSWSGLNWASIPKRGDGHVLELCGEAMRSGPGLT